MFSSADEVLAFIKDEDVKFVDIRFCDLPGVMQHFNVPAESVDEDFFTDGQMFDGSSIRGFQAIHESDMKLVPDPATRLLDPFRDEKTLVINFSILDPFTDERYSRDPRNIASEGRGVPQVDRHRRHRVLRRRGRVLRLRRRALRDEAERRLLLHRLHRGAPGTPVARRRAATSGYKTRYKGGYFPVSPGRPLRRPARRDLPRARGGRPQRRAQPPRGRHRRPDGDQLPLQHAAARRRRPHEVQVRRQERRPGQQGKTATFMPKPLFGDNGSGMHAHQSLWKDGEPLFYDERGYGGLSDMARWYIGGLLKHAPVAARLHQPDGELLPPPGARATRLRSTWSTRPATARPASASRSRARTRRPSASSSACPTRRPTRTCASPRCSWPASTASRTASSRRSRSTRTSTSCRPRSTPRSSRCPARCPRCSTRSRPTTTSSLEGDVFTQDLIETWIDYKRKNEVDPIRFRPHPHEFEMYFDI